MNKLSVSIKIILDLNTFINELKEEQIAWKRVESQMN